MRVFAMAGQYGNSTLNTDLPINHLTWQADAVQDFYSILSMFGMSHGELERIQLCWPKIWRCKCSKSCSSSQLNLSLQPPVIGPKNVGPNI